MGDFPSALQPMRWGFFCLKSAKILPVSSAGEAVGRVMPSIIPTGLGPGLDPGAGGRLFPAGRWLKSRAVGGRLVLS